MRGRERGGCGGCLLPLLLISALLVPLSSAAPGPETRNHELSAIGSESALASDNGVRLLRGYRKGRGIKAAGDEEDDDDAPAAVGGSAGAEGGDVSPQGAEGTHQPAAHLEPSLLAWAQGAREGDACRSLPQDLASEYRSVCSVKDVEPADAQGVGVFEAAVAARAHQGELLLVLIKSDQGADMALQMVLHLRARGWEHAILVFKEEKGCRELRDLAPAAACLWTSALGNLAGGPGNSETPHEASLLYLYAMRAAMRGVGVLAVDGDVFFMADPYPLLRSGYAGAGMVVGRKCFDVPSGADVGCMDPDFFYVRGGRAPDGPVIRLLRGVWERATAAREGRPSGAFVSTPAHPSGAIDLLLADAVDSAISGVATHIRQHHPFKQAEPGRQEGQLGKWEQGMMDCPAPPGSPPFPNPTPGERCVGGALAGGGGPEALVLAPLEVLWGYDVFTWAWEDMGRVRLKNNGKMLKVGHLATMQGGMGRRWLRKAFHWYHWEAEELYAARDARGGAEEEGSSSGKQGGGGGGGREPLRRLAALDPGTMGHVASNTSEEFYAAVETLVHVAHSAGLVPVMPPIPCGLPWRSGPGVDHLMRVVTPGPGRAPYAGPAALPGTECAYLPRAWWDGCVERLVVFPPDLAYQRARWPGQAEARFRRGVKALGRSMKRKRAKAPVVSVRLSAALPSLRDLSAGKPGAGPAESPTGLSGVRTQELLRWCTLVTPPLAADPADPAPRTLPAGGTGPDQGTVVKAEHVWHGPVKKSEAPKPVVSEGFRRPSCDVNPRMCHVRFSYNGTPLRAPGAGTKKGGMGHGAEPGMSIQDGVPDVLLGHHTHFFDREEQGRWAVWHNEAAKRMRGKNARSF